MAEMVTRQELINAKRDARDLGKAVNEKVIVSPRYGEDFKSIPLIVKEGNQEIINLQNAIDIAAAAGAGENGWTAQLIVDGDKTQKQINDNQEQINSRTVTPYDWGAFGDGIAHPLSERYATLAAAQAVFPSATSLTEYIDGLAIQNWLVEIGTVTHNLATCHGKFRVNTNISNAHVNNLNNRMKTKRVDFNAEIVFEGVTGNAFEIISPRQTVFTGWAHGSDIGGSNYQLRTVDNLFYIEDFLHANFSGLKGVAQYAKNLGLYAYSGAAGTTLGGYGANNNTSDLGSWLFVGCGHRFKHNTFNFIARLDTGDSGNSNQRSLLTLSAPHGLGDLRDYFIRFKGKPYLIESSTNTTLTVYPWLTEMDDNGTVEISKGGDFRLQGPDSNLIKISNGSTDCAICASQEGFYLGAKLQRTTENNDIGLRLGNGIDGVQIGGTYLGAYFEDNVFDIVKSSLAQDDAVIINPLALNLAKCHTLLPITADTRVASEGLLNSYKVIYGNKVHQKSKYRFPSGKNGFSEFVLKIGDEPLKIRQNVGSEITLVDDYDVRRNFGTTDVSIEVLGSALNNGTTGDTTVKCESGYTINGLTSDFIIPISNSSFKISARLVDGLDWRVSIFYAEKPFGLKNHNWNPLAANTRQFTTVAAPGARMGSCAIASMDVSLKGTILSAEVTSFGVVTVTQSNPNADSVSDVSGNLFVKLV